MGRRSGALAAALLLASAACSDERPMLRQEAYQSAVDAALRRHLESRGDPALIARDLTVITLGRDITFAPCPLTPEALAGRPGLCSTTPGFARVPARAGCRDAPCVTVLLTPEAWADAGERAAVLSALGDGGAICSEARRFAPNRDASARAAGCGGSSPERVHLHVQLVERRLRPCRNLETPGSQGRGWRPVCDRSVARDIALS